MKGSEVKNQEIVRQSIEESLVIVSRIASNPFPFEPEFNGVLIGVSGLLDSLETVTLLINIEEKVNLKIGKHIDLTARIFERLNNSLTKDELESTILEIIRDS